MDRRRLQIIVESLNTGVLLRVVHLGYKDTFLTVVEISDSPTYAILQTLHCYDLVKNYINTKNLFYQTKL